MCQVREGTFIKVPRYALSEKNAGFAKQKPGIAGLSGFRVFFGEAVALIKI
jgi:hypothetical protein